MYVIWAGILLGLGAAMPIGPVNLEMIRRNIDFGVRYGTAFGLGACLADLIYIVLLSAGALVFLQHTHIMRAIGFVGSLVLLWFAWNIFRMKANTKKISPSKPVVLHYIMQGCLITLLNPYTILFWASVSSQVVLLEQGKQGLWVTSAGVLLGTTAWVVFLNTTIGFTRHYLTEKIILRLNYFGGTVLLFFALRGILKALGYSF